MISRSEERGNRNTMLVFLRQILRIFNGNLLTFWPFLLFLLARNQFSANHNRLKARYLLVLISCLVLGACSTEQTFAPVVEINSIEPLPKSGKYQVRTGETLYEIAWRYGLDYRFLATRNHIAPPYKIYAKQILYLRAKTSKPLVNPLVKNKTVIHVSNVAIIPHTHFSSIVRRNRIEPTVNSAGIYEKDSHAMISHWVKPAKGPIIAYFSGMNKGINIAGRNGDSIFAAAGGKVVYCGNGLRGYGNLIILKHNNVYLSAYAHNRVMFVHEGQWVNKGQKIAEMGNTGTNQTMLHFEIRRAGKPIDPMSKL